jgi:antitoxin ParD1/3/4
MNVSLTPELERLVTAKVQSGMYGSSSEVIRAALRLFAQVERDQAARLEALRRDVRRGADEADSGFVFDGPAVFDALLARRPAKPVAESAARIRIRHPKKTKR